MSRLLELRQKIQDTHALISQIEQTASESAPPSFFANLQSLQKRVEILEREFLVEVVRTRLTGRTAEAMTRPYRAIRACAEWLKTCLDLGWQKDDLDWLEALWWKYHDDRGELIRGGRPDDGPNGAEG